MDMKGTEISLKLAHLFPQQLNTSFFNLPYSLAYNCSIKSGMVTVVNKIGYCGYKLAGLKSTKQITVSKIFITLLYTLFYWHLYTTSMH